MENIKHDLKKVLIISLAPVLFCFLFTVFILKFDILNEFLIFSIVGIFFCLLMLITFHTHNQGIKNGLFFSKNEIIILMNKTAHTATWDKVLIKKSFNLFGIFYVLTFYLPDMEIGYDFIVSPACKNSLLNLVEKYTPKNHDLYRIIHNIKT